MTRSQQVALLVTALVLIGSVGPAAMPVTADRAHIRISSVSVTPSDPTTGERVLLETEILNLESSDQVVEITRIHVRTAGSAETHGRIENVGSLGPGGSVTVPLSATFDTAGQKSLTVYVLVRGENGSSRSYEYPVSIDVSETSVSAELTATTFDNESTEVTLTNFGNVNLTNVETTATVDGEVVERRSMFDVERGSSQSVQFDTQGRNGETVTFTASYTAAGRTHTTTRSHVVDYPVPGEVRLTGIEITQTATGVLIRGEAVNVGSTDTGSVLVSVRRGEGVSPASPSGEYFVGAIDASEFATFELTAAVQPEAKSIPVEITYIVDGRQITTTQRLEYETVSSDGSQAANGGSDSTADSGGPLGGPALLVVGLVVLVFGVGAYRWRKQ